MGEALNGDEFYESTYEERLVVKKGHTVVFQPIYYYFSISPPFDAGMRMRCNSLLLFETDKFEHIVKGDA